MKTLLLRTALVPALLGLSTLHAQVSLSPLGTAFTYQGRLVDRGNPAQGNWDLHFTIYDAADGGSPIAGPITNSPVAVTNGLFTLTLDFGPSVFDGNDRWLQIAVRTNNVGAFTTLTPRQPVSPAPYALYAPRAAHADSATTAQSAALAIGVLPDSIGNGALMADAVDSAKIADGSIAAADLSPTLASNTFWRLRGNSGTSPSLDFIGTLDTNSLKFRVNNTVGWRMEPAWLAPNIIGGGENNRVATYATVIGGGVNNTVATNSPYSLIGAGTGNSIGTNSFDTVVAGGGVNSVAAEAPFSAIHGGVYNSVGYGAQYGVIGGGFMNLLGTNAINSTIAGGYQCTVGNNGGDSSIGGGYDNHVLDGAYGSTIAGGMHNTNGGRWSIVPGGIGNAAMGESSFAAGLFAKALHPGVFVWADNQWADFASTANNQFLIRAAGGVGIGKVNPATALDVNGTVTATAFNGTFAGSGAGLTNVWQLGGNAGTIPGANFIGTTDNRPLDVVVNNQRGFRLEPGGSNSVNVIGGWSGNSVAPGVVGATVAGGGAGYYYTQAYSNRVAAPFGTVSGGAGNVIGWSWHSTIGGGQLNSIPAGGNTTISGGALNTNAADAGTIGGGVQNTIEYLVQNSTIGGGSMNTIVARADNATISGGDHNSIQSWAEHATIGGGYQNLIQTNSVYATIGGGAANTIQTFANESTIGGGTGNMIRDHAYYGTIAGGFGNSIQTNTANATIGGGDRNEIRTSGSYSTIGGGIGNTILDNGDYATIPGGYANAAASYAFAAGCQAKANHSGSFVWADYALEDFASTANNQFLIRARGGVGINKTNPAAALDIDGTVRVNDNDLYLRGDLHHGIGWYGSTKPFGSATPDGPVVYGYSGGGLGSLRSGVATNLALSWNSSGGVSVSGALNVNGGVTISDDVRLNNKQIYFRDGSDTFHGLGWFASTTFAGSNPDGPVLYGCGGGALGTACDSQVIALAWNSSGNVGIGTTSPDARLTVNGTADKPGGGSWSTFSDARLKDVGDKFTHGLRDLEALQPVRYHYKADNPLQLPTEPEYVGVVAQAVQQAVPEAVERNQDGYLTVNNDPIIWTMVNAIKELNRKIDERNAENAELKQTVRELKNLVAGLSRKLKESDR